MHIHVLLNLGSNREPRKNLASALRRISELPEVELRVVGPPFESSAESGGDGTYLNLAAAIVTTREQQTLRDEFRNIEADLGRDRGSTPERVPIDIDIIRFGDDAPDESLHTRGYVAIPTLAAFPSQRDWEIADRSLGEWAVALDPHGRIVPVAPLTAEPPE